jgi:NDP-sugar pyrophosphorylase family protein
MKAILLAGGKGTRLRPLTLHTPKPVVPIFDKPFLQYQIDLIRQVPEIDEVIVSLNYQPDQIEKIIGDGKNFGLKIRYLVEPTPFGTAGAVKYAEKLLDESVVVFNGDVLTQIDLAKVIKQHNSLKSKATIVLTPVDNPASYGLVETRSDGSVKQFLEKPSPGEITCNTINAGIYVLETDTLDRIPKDTPWSIERSYFPSLVERKENFFAYIYNGYWTDIGTPEKYQQVHRDIMDGNYLAAPFSGEGRTFVSLNPSAQVADDTEIIGPCFIANNAVIKSGARILPYSVIGPRCHIDKDVVIEDTILWADSQIDQGAIVQGAILGQQCHIMANTRIKPQTVIGSASTLTSYNHA